MRSALVVLSVALAGAGLASLCFFVHWGVALALVLLGCATGWLLFFSGRRAVERDPIGALKRMEWRILLPGSLAAAGAGLVILISVWLQTKDEWSDERTQLVTALSAALTTFVGALFVKGAETYDETWMAEPIKNAFIEKLSDVLPEGSDGEVALQNIQGDWGRIDRRQRAEIIDSELHSPTPVE